MLYVKGWAKVISLFQSSTEGIQYKNFIPFKNQVHSQIKNGYMFNKILKNYQQSGQDPEVQKQFNSGERHKIKRKFDRVFFRKPYKQYSGNHCEQNKKRINKQEGVMKKLL